ncbi:MAG: hypothetical protein ACYCSS_03510 [Sulfuriferula sp.]
MTDFMASAVQDAAQARYRASRSRVLCIGTAVAARTRFERAFARRRKLLRVELKNGN